MTRNKRNETHQSSHGNFLAKVGKRKKIHCVIDLIKQVGNWIIKIKYVLCIYHGLVMPPPTRHKIKGMKLISLVIATSFQKRESEKKNTLHN